MRDVLLLRVEDWRNYVRDGDGRRIDDAHHVGLHDAMRLIGGEQAVVDWDAAGLELGPVDLDDGAYEPWVVLWDHDRHDDRRGAIRVHRWGPRFVYDPSRVATRRWYTDDFKTSFGSISGSVEDTP